MYSYIYIYMNICTYIHTYVHIYSSHFGLQYEASMIIHMYIKVYTYQTNVLLLPSMYSNLPRPNLFFANLITSERGIFERQSVNFRV